MLYNASLSVNDTMAYELGRLILVFYIVLSSYSREVCIAPNGNIVKHHSCKLSLDEFCSAGVPDDIVVTLLAGTHKLSTVCEMQDVSNVTFRGEDRFNVVIDCLLDSETGFKFLNVFMMSISGLEFKGCGAYARHEVDPTPYDFPYNISSTLIFLNGSDLTLNSVTISDSTSPGFYIYDVTGVVNIDLCTVSNASSDKLTVAGSNVVFYDSYVAMETHVIISNSSFVDSGTQIQGLHYYSSAVVIVLGNAELTLDITKSNFTRNRSYGLKSTGGNLAIYFFESSSVTISHTNFLDGYSDLVGGGLFVQFNSGGLYVGFGDSFSAQGRTFSPTLNIANCSFVNNMAHLYGGGAYVTWVESKLRPGNMSISISDTTFSRNTIGMRGGGLGLQIQANFNYFLPELLPILFVDMKISRCEFREHFPDPSPANHHLSESSAIMMSSVSYMEIEDVIVESNNCTGIKAVGSNLVFYGLNQISNNTAVTGAGLQLTNTVIDLVNARTNLTITNNYALYVGGGIHVHTSSDCTAFVNSICFILMRATTQSTVNFTISNNKALKGGDNTFGVNYRACSHDWKTQYVLHVPENEICRPSSRSSKPQQVCIGSHYVTDCDAASNNNENETCIKVFNATIYPGVSLTLPVYLRGESGGFVSGTVLTGIEGNAVIPYEDKLQSVDMTGGNLTYTIYSTNQFEEEVAHLTLRPTNYDCSVGNSPVADIKLNFIDCPFGFENTKFEVSSSNGFRCQCIANPVIFTCSIDNQTITKQKYSWVGMFQRDNKTYLATNENCPLDYCNSFLDIKSLQENLSQDEQCQYNRTGVLCGSCPKGWSLVLGSSECREQCSSVWLLLIFPFALAGILLVLVIHFLNLTVTTGTVHGLIFYANILRDYSVDVLSKHHPVPGLTQTLQIFLSWLNLDLGISTCFYGGMEAFGKTMFLFLFPLFIWLLSAFIVVLSNRYIFITKLVGDNAVKVLSTLILLSYSKMLRVTIAALRMKTVELYFNNSNSTSMLRWAVDGNIAYLNTQRHLVLFVIALLLVLMLLPFTFILLCIRHVYSLSNCSRVFAWIDKLKPFFDTYTGPFKDSARFWVGLLLFVRLVVLILHALDFKNNTIPYYIIVTASLFLSALMVLLQGVYNKHHLNVLEHFFILNLSLVFLINIYKDSSEYWTSILSHLLVGSALLVFLGIVAHRVYLKCSKRRCIERPSLVAHNFDVDFENMRGYEPLVRN